MTSEPRRPNPTEPEGRDIRPLEIVGLIAILVVVIFVFGFAGYGMTGCGS